MNLYQIIKPLLFEIDPEFVHDTMIHLTSKYPQLLSALCPKVAPSLKYKTQGQSINWDFPVGLAAGLDKNASSIDFFSSLGFGAIEFGTVTLAAQGGNPKPRITRYPAVLDLRNSMGFPSAGLDVVKKNLSHSKMKINLGANIGKNKLTDGDDVFREYATLYKELSAISQYVVVNVSSPNTPGLRNLQNKEYLEKIFSSIREENKNSTTPLFVKIAPDVSDKQLHDFVQVCSDYNLAGIVATNTTLDHSLGVGGLSGHCLKKKSAIIRGKLLAMTKNTQLDLIGVGGIDSFDDLKIFWQQGGQFVQVYTGFIYQGPQMLVNIQSEIDEFLKKENLDSLTQYFSQRK